MRIARFVHNGQIRFGVVEGGGAVPFPVGVDLARLLPSGLDDLTPAVTAPLPLPELAPRAPLDPPTIREPAGPLWNDGPVFSFQDPYAVIGPAADVPLAPGSATLDCVPQVAAVIGRAGHHLSPARARDHIAGYLILNAWSLAGAGAGAQAGVRDGDATRAGVGAGAGVRDGDATRAGVGAVGPRWATTLGPWLVTADEFDPTGRLVGDLVVAVNGRVVRRAPLAGMAWPFADLVAYASRGTWVRSGDVIGGGFPGRSVPCGPVGVGDVVAVAVDGIGSIGNRVVPGLPPST